MGVKEWAVPIVAALATFGLLWVLQPHPAASAGPEFVNPFHDDLRVNATSHDPLQLLVLAKTPQKLGLDGPSGVTWRTPYVGLVGSQNGDIVCIRAPCDPLQGPTIHHHAPADAPLFGADGNNATRVTCYVFDETGTLVASNADAANRSRFRGGANAQDLPDSLWYLGANDTAPPGTERLPGMAAALVGRLMPQLEGLPVGGVASDSSNALVALYGTLFVTVQVDEIVQAP